MNLSYYPRETNLIHRLAPLFEERGYSIKPFSNADLGKIDLFLLEKDHVFESKVSLQI